MECIISPFIDIPPIRCDTSVTEGAEAGGTTGGRTICPGVAGCEWCAGTLFGCVPCETVLASPCMVGEGRRGAAGGGCG